MVCSVFGRKTINTFFPVLQEQFHVTKQVLCQIFEQFFFFHNTAHPRCKNLLSSRVTKNRENKEVKTTDRTNIIVTKQRKPSQVLTPS